MRKTVLIVLMTISTTSAMATDTLSYGSRSGISVDIGSATGLDAAKAVIHTKHSRDDAIAFCTGYADKVAEACIREGMAVPLKRSSPPMATPASSPILRATGTALLV